MPWTRRLLVERRVTTWEGQEVALLPFVRSRREALVLKPVDGYGGFGVVVGAHVEQPAWEHALDEAVGGARPFVAQRFVPLPRQRVFALDDAGQVRSEEQYIVHSFWMHEERFAGAFMRASTAPVVNVHQGGGLAPVFFHPPLL